jgi:hypothetical protein
MDLLMVGRFWYPILSQEWVRMKGIQCGHGRKMRRTRLTFESIP